LKQALLKIRDKEVINMEYRRRCETCNIQIELVRVLGNYYHFQCPNCRKVIIFSVYPGRKEEKK